MKRILTIAGLLFFACVCAKAEEFDPVFLSSPAAGITVSSITNWNTAYGWGDHPITSTATLASGLDSVQATLSTATASNTTNTLVLRDGSGNFAASTITATLIGAASLNVLKSGDTMTGGLYVTAPVSASYFQINYSTVIAYTNGSLNVGISAGQGNTAMANTFIGSNAGFTNVNGAYNTFLGADAGYHNYTGEGNTFLGYNSGSGGYMGWGNVFVGYSAGAGLTSGNSNVAIGNYAGLGSAAATGSVFIGNYAGLYSGGSNNVYVGNNAGISNTGDNNILIGWGTAVSLLDADNSLNIGNVIYGDLSNSKIGIATEAPHYTFDVTGDAHFTSSMTVDGGYYGDGSHLTGITAATYLADGVSLDLTGSTFSAKASSVTLQGNSFNGASQLVRLDGSSRLPAVDGSLLTGISGSASTIDVVPVGTFIQYGSTVAPRAFLYCDGTNYSTTTYSALFAVIGYSYGGSGGNFTCDFRGMFMRGLDGGRGLDQESTRVMGSTETDKVVDHTHQAYAAASFAAGGGGASSSALGAGVTGYVSSPKGGGTETRPKNIAVAVMVKYTLFGSTTSINLLDSTNTWTAPQTVNIVGNVTGNVTGNAATASTADTATILKTARTINGVSFDGSANINISTVSYLADEASLTIAGATFSAKPSSVTLQGNTFNAANQLVKLDGNTKLPAVDGSALLNLPSTEGGAVLASTQVFSGQNSFNGTNGALPNFTGMIAFFVSASSVCPTGWVYPAGQTLSTTTYSALYAFMGYTWGGSGANFALPNMQNGEFIRAVSTGTQGGNMSGGLGAYQADTFQGHYHNFSYFTPPGQAGAGSLYGVNGAGSIDTVVRLPVTDTTNGIPRTGKETRPRNYAMIPCIKY